jgi:hypothetical protein
MRRRSARLAGGHYSERNALTLRALISAYTWQSHVPSLRKPIVKKESGLRNMPI